MKRIITVVFILMYFGINIKSFAQLSGTKSIPGDYATIAAAISDLNANGVGSGGVTFNVAAGHTETASNLVISITSNPPTSSNTVVFQKSGTGANPLITAAPGVSASYDGIIRLSGADYITFDAIDLLDPATNTGNAVMEWGYAIMRADTSNGSQYNVIKNCTITLQKISSLSYGIYIINRDTNGTVRNTGIASGLNSYNKLYGNTITNVYKGIVAISASTTGQKDIDNEIGVNGQSPNSITNWGGSTISAEGIRCEGQTNVKINNNIINGGAGTGGSAATVGIIATLFGSLPNAGNYEISYNQVTISANSSSQAHYGIRALANGDTVRIHHNTVENCNSGQTTNAFYALDHDPVGSINAVYVYNNIIRNNSHSGTGTTNLLYVVGSGTINTLDIYSNEIYGNQKTGASGTMNCIQTSVGDIDCYLNTVYNNSMPGSSGTSAGSINGYYNSLNNPATEKVYDNTIYNLTVGGSNTSTSSFVTGIRSNLSSTATTVKQIYGNLIYGLSGVSGTSASGGVYGIYSSNGASMKIYQNKIYNLSNTGSTGTSAGCWVSSGPSIQIYNNFISEIKAANSTNANAVMGISSTSTTSNSTLGIYYNSVYLSASGGSTFGSSGVSVSANATSTTAALDMRDNIIINLSTPGSTSGVSTAYRRSSANLQNYASVSDYNLLYAGSSASNKLVFFDGTNSDQNLASYKSRVAPRDNYSVSKAVNFVNTVTGDLHLTGGSINDHELAGTPLSIANDFDGDTRSTLHPYMGADESTAFTLAALTLTVNLEACSPTQDTITVYLKSSSSPYATVDVAKGYLNPSGSVTLNYFYALDGVNYYIVCNHRNSIDTWSKSGGEVFTGGALTYNFTTAASQAYGNNMILVGPKYSFYTGDVNKDELVDGADGLLIDNDSYNFATGYLNTDLNYDTIVDGTDAAYASNNSANFVSVAKP